MSGETNKILKPIKTFLKQSCIRSLSVKLHLRHERRSSVRLSVVSVRGVHPMGRGDEPRCFIEIKGGIKIRDQPINTRKVVSSLSGKSSNYRHQMSNFKAKYCTKFDSVRSSVRPFVSWMEFDTNTVRP